MGKIAFVFAGQGAQAPGMGRELYETSPAAKGVLDMAEALRPGTLRQCFWGTQEELAVTANTQPCLMAVDVACAAALTAQGITPDLCAGFSLGEVAAIAFSGMLTFEEAFIFVQERALFMQSCAEEFPGFMAAVLRLSNDHMISLCQTLDQVYPVNFNAPGQVVVSGAAAQKDTFLQAVAQAGGRAIPLKVSGAFHSPFMEQAALRLEAMLNGMALKSPALPVYANLTAQPYGENACATLARQVDHPVLWEDTVRAMALAGADTFVELGPGTVLSGLIGRILPDAAVCHVEDQNSLVQTLDRLKGRGA